MDSVIHLENIIKTYYMGSNSLTVLKGIALDIYRNEYVALMGPSGSGKSTLMNIIGCLDTPSSGTYVLNGSDVSKMSDDDLAVFRNQTIGFVFQSFNLLPRLTAVENVELPMIYGGIPPKERRERAVELLTRVGLGARMGHKPTQLSGGQQQRVAIARSLAGKPSLLLADEPTGSLDTENAALMTSLLNTLKKEENLAMVVVTHSPELASAMETCYRLRSGKLEKA